MVLFPFEYQKQEKEKPAQEPLYIELYPPQLEEIPKKEEKKIIIIELF